MDTFNRICFDKPDLFQLNKKNTVVDMHFHSRWSDGTSTIEEIAAYAEELGIGVAITDHNEIGGAVEIDQYKNVLSIPGIEVTSREGTHILIYFYDVKSLKKFYTRSVRPFMGSSVMSSLSIDVDEILKKAKKYKTLVVFPHPFSAAFTGICNHSFSNDRLKRLLNVADGVEVINSENLKRWNLKSALLGFNLNRSITGGSDGHTLKQLGAAVTYAQCRKKRAAFLDAVKKSRVKVVGKETQILGKISSNSMKLKNSLNNYPDIVEKNITYGKSVIHFKSNRITERVWDKVNDRQMMKALRLVAGISFIKLNFNALPLLFFTIS